MQLANIGTPGMGMNLWGESPLWVSQHRIWSRVMGFRTKSHDKAHR